MSKKSTPYKKRFAEYFTLFRAAAPKMPEPPEPKEAFAGNRGNSASPQKTAHRRKEKNNDKKTRQTIGAAKK